MSIFANIASAIFGHGSAPHTTSIAGQGVPWGAKGAAAGAGVKPLSRAEVEAMIEKLADAQNEQYNWEQSIVDLMKLLELDSSLSARKQLAQELGYTGALGGSAEMNIWLHQQVMTKLAESGGVVPLALRSASGIANVEKLLEKLEREREPVFSRKVLARVNEIAKDKRKAITFLQERGFLDEKGKLAAKYRP